MVLMSSKTEPLPMTGETEPWTSLQISNFDGGLILDVPDTNISDNQFTRLQNFYIDDDKGFLSTRGPFQPYFVNTSESKLATAPETFKFMTLQGTEILVASREAGSDMALEFWETGGTDEWVSILSSNLTTGNQVNFEIFRINDAQDLIIANGKDVPLRWNDTSITDDNPATIDNAATNLGLTAPAHLQFAITGITKANPAVITVTGDASALVATGIVLVTDVAEDAQYNKEWTVASISGTGPTVITTTESSAGFAAPGTTGVLHLDGVVTANAAVAFGQGIEFNGTYTYAFTYCYDDGGTTTKFGESGMDLNHPVTISDIGETDRATVTVHPFFTIPSGVTKINVYRGPADESSGPYRLVGTITDLASEWIDSTPIGQEGAEAPADAGTPPRLKFPVVANGRVWGVGLNASGGLNYKLVYSEDGQPDMYLAANFRYLPSEIRGIKEFNRDLYIFTEDRIYWIKEADPANKMLKISNRGCTSHNSIVDIGNGLVWQAKDGIFWADFNIRALDGDYPIAIADGLASEFKNIAASQRANSVGVLYNERYYISYTASGSTNNKTLIWHINKLPLIISGKLKTAGWTDNNWAANYFDVFSPNALDEHLYTADAANLYIQEHDVFGTVDYLNFTDFNGSDSQDIPIAFTSKRFHFQDLASNTIHSSIALATKTSSLTITASLNIQKKDGSSFDKAKTIVPATGTLPSGTALYGSAIYGTDVYGENVKAFKQRHVRWPNGSKGRNAQLSLTSNAGNDTDILLITLKHREEPITY